MASQVLRSGWKELLWVDASVDFDLGGIALARSSGKDIVGAVYPSEDGVGFATQFLKGTKEVRLGETGGLLEVQHTGMGFLFTRRNVYDEMQKLLKLPQCNEGNIIYAQPHHNDHLFPWHFTQTHMTHLINMS